MKRQPFHLLLRWGLITAPLSALLSLATGTSRIASLRAYLAVFSVWLLVTMLWPSQLLKTHIKPVALTAGRPNIGWHSFRHTVSAWSKEAGLELEEVKTLLRHENIVTTSDVYGDLGMDAKRRIQDQLVEFAGAFKTTFQGRSSVARLRIVRLPKP